MLTYAVENPLAIEGELRPLLPLHMDEFNIYGEPFENAPNFEAYRKLASIGLLSAITVRDDDRLVGYGLVVLFPDLHHEINGQPVMAMTSSAFHILPEYRAKCAKRFFDEIEKFAVERGASVVGHRVRPNNKASAFLSAIGYHVGEVLLVKPIGEAARCQISA